MPNRSNKHAKPRSNAIRSHTPPAAPLLRRVRAAHPNLARLLLCAVVTVRLTRPCAHARRLQSQPFADAATTYIEVPEAQLVHFPQDYGCLYHRNVQGQAKTAAWVALRIPALTSWLRSSAKDQPAIFRLSMFLSAPEVGLSFTNANKQRLLAFNVVLFHLFEMWRCSAVSVDSGWCSIVRP